MWSAGPGRCRHTLLHRAIDENQEDVACFLIRQWALAFTGCWRDWHAEIMYWCRSGISGSMGISHVKGSLLFRPNILHRSTQALLGPSLGKVCFLWNVLERYYQTHFFQWDARCHSHVCLKVGSFCCKYSLSCKIHIWVVAALPLYQWWIQVICYHFLLWCFLWFCMRHIHWPFGGTMGVLGARCVFWGHGGCLSRLAVPNVTAEAAVLTSLYKTWCLRPLYQHHSLVCDTNVNWTSIYLWNIDDKFSLLAIDVGEPVYREQHLYYTVVVEQRMRWSHWLRPVLEGSFSALTLLVGWQEGYLAGKKICTTYPQRFFSGTSVGRKPRGTG